MPSKNPVGVAAFQPFKHFIENRPTWFFGGLTLNEFLDDCDIFTAGKLVKLGQLISDASHLTRQIIRGLSGIQKEFAWFGGIHAGAQQREMESALRDGYPHPSARARASDFLYLHTSFTAC